ncbi:glycosyltransferase family 4 protein [Olleya sp. HaHaR_3_96]|uniref:glycosyltransferase family 4 protein n=1 Tax=Olleya sp. HaHaR_3_96 TaxID=2745560 RepID=UPI001C4E593E|nr:glycosyltransferase family 4 protein [Olleya sp. HaHaR_3_96]QXP60673.1 glycosyltransferase family 4 protein [Olleya sp. HaHaR_3_96]
MNVLFLTMAKINSIDERGIYTDLLREFINNKYDIYIVSPVERKHKKKTSLIKKDKVQILNVKTFNIQKTNIIEKGIGTLAIEYQYLKAIKKHFSDVKFDLILYSTPPITFSKVISYIKKRDNAYAYLLLKDIFPQNAVDLKLIKKDGFLHKMFLKKEQRLYQLSNTIGCMSEANKQYVLKHNPTIKASKVEVNPNSIFPIEVEEKTEEFKKSIRKKHSIPENKKVFIYGGNLGQPQGIDFLLKTMEVVKNKNVFFLIVGSGTEYPKVLNWFQSNTPQNAKLLPYLDKKDYDDLVSVCDIGLIFLHKNFTIPNFPSRLLSYLEMKLPVLAATDVNTDIGKVIENNNCGYWVESGDVKAMLIAVDKIISNEQQCNNMKENGWQLLKKEYHVSKSFKLINKKLEDV